uniref:Secreted protein n=1 Tax=Rhabditophanes sp. KR3021 TaxID=114890 RepID=A0AC35TKC5_9BILA
MHIFKFALLACFLFGICMGAPSKRSTEDQISEDKQDTRNIADNIDDGIADKNKSLDQVGSAISTEAYEGAKNLESIAETNISEGDNIFSNNEDDSDKNTNEVLGQAAYHAQENIDDTDETSPGIGEKLSNVAKSVGNALSSGADAVANFITGNDQVVRDKSTEVAEATDKKFDQINNGQKNIEDVVKDDAVVSNRKLHSLNTHGNQGTDQIQTQINNEAKIAHDMTRRLRKDVSSRVDDALSGAKDRLYNTTDHLSEAPFKDSVIRNT